MIKLDQDLTEEQVRDTLYNIWGEKELLLKHRDLYGNFPQLEDKTEINGNLPWVIFNHQGIADFSLLWNAQIKIFDEVFSILQENVLSTCSS